MKALRRAGVAAVLLLLVAVGAAAVGWILRARLASWALSRATSHEVRVLDVRLTGSGLHALGASLLDVEIAPAGGGVFLRVDEAAVDGLWAALRGGRIARLRLMTPRLDLARGADGRWNVAALLGLDRDAPPGTPSPAGAPGPSIDAIAVRGGLIEVRDPLRLRLSSIDADVDAGGAAFDLAAHLEAPGAAETLPAVDLRLSARRAGAGWRVETAAARALGDGLRLDFACDLGETAARLSVRRAAVAETILRAVAPEVWRRGRIESDSIVATVAVDGAWSLDGGARADGCLLRLDGRDVAVGRATLSAAARGVGREGAGSGAVSVAGGRARWSGTVTGGHRRLEIDDMRLEGAALRLAAALAGIPGEIERGRLTGRASAEDGGDGWGAGADLLLEEVRLAAAGRRFDLLYDTLSVEARPLGESGGIRVLLSANVEDAAAVSFDGVLSPGGAARSVETFAVAVRRPSDVAALLGLPVALPTGRLDLALRGAAEGETLALGGTLRVERLGVRHESAAVEVRGLGGALAVRLRLPAVLSSWADPMHLVRGLSFDEAEITADRLGVGIYGAEAVRLRASAEGGAFTVHDAAFDLYGGRGRWLRDASYRAEDGFFEVALEAEGIDLGRFSVDLAKAHEAFRPPKIPAGAVPLSGRVDGRAVLLGDSKRGLMTVQLDFDGETGGAVVVHNSIARMLYDRFASGALSSALDAVRTRAEEAIETAVVSGLSAAGRRFGVDTPGAVSFDSGGVEIRARVTERIERRLAAENYSFYPAASARYFYDVDQPWKRLRLILREGEDPERDNINYDVKVAIPVDQDPFQLFGMLVAGEIVNLRDIGYDWTQEE